MAVKCFTDQVRNTPASGYKVDATAMELWSMRILTSMKVSGSKIKDTAMENQCLTLAVSKNGMKETGNKTKCMEKALLDQHKVSNKTVFGSKAICKLK